MRRRAAAAQRRGQVLGREHLPRRGVPEVHVRVRRVRENRPRGLGRGGASLEGEGKRGTRGERVVGQQNACVVRDDRMGFFKTRGERGGTIPRAPSQTWRATPRETSAATPPRPSPSATRPGSSSRRANRTEDRERQTRHVIIPRRRAETCWNERAAAVDDERKPHQVLFAIFLLEGFVERADVSFFVQPKIRRRVTAPVARVGALDGARGGGRSRARVHRARHDDSAGASPSSARSSRGRRARGVIFRSRG